MLKKTTITLAAIAAVVMMTAITVVETTAQSEAEAVAADVRDAQAAAKRSQHDERIKAGPLPITHIYDVDEGEEYDDESTHGGRRIMIAAGRL